MEPLSNEMDKFKAINDGIKSDYTNMQIFFFKKATFSIAKGLQH